MAGGYEAAASSDGQWTWDPPMPAKEWGAAGIGFRVSTFGKIGENRILVLAVMDSLFVGTVPDMYYAY
uniref:Uncharacterized protein n=1 Tax=Oryza sativa subsp. japonica TaxID=39947 RepID=Q69MJ3_ORYSJ|nr:hypothetical protein [Oryza sativa Japonica Group]